ncbi:MAG: transposase [Candidatus Methanofishera endochildressiae]|uniref:Transposase n=1 Tax=Candidatus Methanofishera endochildressiae TaxID=2738884 RepID=A0A7Z0SD47_9GAMM|nr:transposase [Candidatus Methanofishera endochildressiae]
MRHLDGLHLLYPFYGARRLRDAIVDDHGLIVNRKLVRRLMILMDIQAIFPDNKGTSKPDKVHRIYPYLLKNLEIYHSNRVVVKILPYLPRAPGFSLF